MVWFLLCGTMKEAYVTVNGRNRSKRTKIHCHVPHRRQWYIYDSLWECDIDTSVAMVDYILCGAIFYIHVLTHLPLDKMTVFSQMIYSGAISLMKCFVFWLKFHWSLVLRVQLTITSTGSDNGLSPNRRQAIIWTNADLNRGTSGGGGGGIDKSPWLLCPIRRLEEH